MTTQVAILLPGIMGSELRLGDKLIWPGSASSLIFPYKLMDELLRPDLVATDIIRSFSISEQYDALIKDLTTFGFRLNTSPPTLHLFPYDWRKSNAEAAEKLADRIDQISAQFNAQCEISLVAHSMGGLVSRYYLESGRFNGRTGFKRIKQLITLGTPHRGAVLALMAILGEEKRLFLSKDQVKRLANDARYPSVYELLPPPDEPFLWDEKSLRGFDPLPLENYAGPLNLTASSLQSARKFQGSLDLRKKPNEVRYFFCVGSSHLTSCAALLLDLAPKPPRVRRVEQEDSGDGTVPIWSGALTGVQSRPVGGEHGSIYKDLNLRATLAILFGYRNVLAAVPPKVQLSVRERVVEPDDEIRLTLTPETVTKSIAGSLRFEKLVTDKFQPLPAAAVDVDYQGAAAEKLSLVMKAPSDPGAYRLAFIPRGAAAAVASDDVFVQEPV